MHSGYYVTDKQRSQVTQMADFRTEVKPIAVLGFNENASRNLSVQIAKRETRIVVRDRKSVV